MDGYAQKLYVIETCFKMDKIMVEIKKTKLAIIKSNFEKYAPKDYFLDFQGSELCSGDVFLCRVSDLLATDEVVIVDGYEVAPYLASASHRNYCGWQDKKIAFTTSLDTAMSIARNYLVRERG